jgi:hypothetical protein
MVVRATLPRSENKTVNSKNLSSDLSPTAARFRDSNPKSCFVSTYLVRISLIEERSFCDFVGINLGNETSTVPSKINKIVFFNFRYGSITVFPFSHPEIMNVSNILLEKFLESFWKKGSLPSNAFNWLRSRTTCRLFPRHARTYETLKAKT